MKQNIGVYITLSITPKYCTAFKAIAHHITAFLEQISNVPKKEIKATTCVLYTGVFKNNLMYQY